MRNAVITHPITGPYSFELENSRLGFVTYSASGARVRGSFTRFAGGGYLDIADPARSHVSLTIESASIETGDADRDARLRGDDVLDVRRFPTIGFVSTSVDRVESNVFRIAGDVAIKRERRPITVDFELMYSGVTIGDPRYQRLGFSGRAVMTLLDWGIYRNVVLDAGEACVATLAALELDLSAIKRV